MTTYSLTHGTIFALYDLEAERFVDGREWDDADIARAFVDRSLSAELKARLEVRPLRTYKLEDDFDTHLRNHEDRLELELVLESDDEGSVIVEDAPTVDPLDVVVAVPRTGARANLSSISRHYVSGIKTEGGYVALSCECGEGDVVLDRLASETDEAELVKLLEHSLFDHVMPHRLEVRKVEDALDLLSIPAAEDGSVVIGLGR